MDPWIWVVLCGAISGVLAMLIAVVLLGNDENYEEDEPR